MFFDSAFIAVCTIAASEKENPEWRWKGLNIKQLLYGRNTHQKTSQNHNNGDSYRDYSAHGKHNSLNNYDSHDNRNDSKKYGNHSNIQNWLPIADIRDGVVITKDGRFVKILEVLPVNFYLKSAIEQQNIIHYFASYLKIAPDNLQILVITQKADIEAYIKRMWTLYETETNENCKEMIADNIAEVEYLAEREALTRRFFIVLQFEPKMRLRGNNVSSILQRLAEEAETARQYLDMCGLEVLQPVVNSDMALCETLYGLLNRRTSKKVRLPTSIMSMTEEVHSWQGVE